MSHRAEFTTANLAVAAFLTAGKHLRLMDVDASDSRRALFVFEDPEARGGELEAGFLTGGALVPGAEFHRQLRVLRRLIEERSGDRYVPSAARNKTSSRTAQSEGYKDHAKAIF